MRQPHSLQMRSKMSLFSALPGKRPCWSKISLFLKPCDYTFRAGGMGGCGLCFNLYAEFGEKGIVIMRKTGLRH